MSATIKACLKEIDQLERSAYKHIHTISSGQYISDSDELPEVSRSTQVKEANELIRRIPDLLCVIDVALRNSNQEETERLFLREKYELYQQKELTLKLELKKAQLSAYAKENQAIHEQRLAKYNCIATDTEKKPLSTDLFEGRSAKLSAKEHSVEEQITSHNKNITSSLKQTRQLMTMSVMQTELNIDSLDQQYKDLNTFNSKMVDMESILLKSRQIVKFIEKQDRNDKRRIYMAVGFLLLCSAWVLWRRVLKTPVRILMWTILKTFGVVNWITSKTLTQKIDYGLSSLDINSESIMSTSTIAPTLTSSYGHYVQDVEDVLKILTWSAETEEPGTHLYSEIVPGPSLYSKTILESSLTATTSTLLSTTTVLENEYEEIPLQETESNKINMIDTVESALDDETVNELSQENSSIASDDLELSETLNSIETTAAEQSTSHMTAATSLSTIDTHDHSNVYSVDAETETSLIPIEEPIATLLPSDKDSFPAHEAIAVELDENLNEEIPETLSDTDCLGVLNDRDYESN